MEVIGIDITLTIEKVTEFIHTIFPQKEITYHKNNYDDFFLYDGTKHLQLNYKEKVTGSIYIEVENTESEFPTVISLFGFEKINTESREQFIAFQLSQHFKCKSIVSAPSKMFNHPFANLLLYKGKTFEVDDSNSSWGDGTKNNVKIKEEINLSFSSFDEKGNTTQTI